MKKLLTILLSVVLCLGLAMAIGCNKDSGDYEVTAEEFVAAISFANETNYKISAVNTEYNTNDTTETYTLIAERVENKIKFVQSDETETETIYLEKDGETCYIYSLDGADYVKAPVDAMYFDTYATCNIANMGFEYSQFTYNAEAKAYEAASVTVGGSEYTNVSFKFENNKLVSFTASVSYGEYGSSTQVATITYGDAAVTLPTVA